MSHHLDIYEEAPPATLPRVLKWPLFVIAFPVVLLTAIVWLLVILLRSKTSAPVNSTPCGKLCKYAYWLEAKPDTPWGWRCRAYRGKGVDSARRHFTAEQDPNNCTMFEKNYSL